MAVADFGLVGTAAGESPFEVAGASVGVDARGGVGAEAAGVPDILATVVGVIPPDAIPHAGDRPLCEHWDADGGVANGKQLPD